GAHPRVGAWDRTCPARSGGDASGIQCDLSYCVQVQGDELVRSKDIQRRMGGAEQVVDREERIERRIDRDLEVIRDAGLSDGGDKLAPGRVVHGAMAGTGRL